MRIRCAVSVGVLVASCWVATLPSQAQVADESSRQAVARLAQAAGGQLHVRYSPHSGRAQFVSAREGVLVRGATPAARARSFLREHGSAFGLSDVSQLRAVRSRSDAAVGMDHVRLRQEVSGVPVVGAELFVHLRGDRVRSTHGRLLPEAGTVDVSPTVDAVEAEARARRMAVARLEMEDPAVSPGRLEIVSKGIFDGRRHPVHLAWFFELRQGHRRHFIWVSAHRGNVVLHFEQAPSARDRNVYTADSTDVLPGTLIGTEATPPTGDADAVAAFDFSGDTYDFFHDVLGRDSFDDAGAAIDSTVHYCPSPSDCPMENAYWSGSQMVYGDGFSRADDVVGHELTHAVTQYSAGLYYYMQSGALNESFSDIFGETVDLWNTSRGDETRRGTDTEAVRWQMGEDVPGYGAIRNMMDPNVFGDPGRVSDPMFWCLDSTYYDRGGVHFNSGVPNHAYALMVDGGSYNGVIVTGIGLEKAARVQYRALTEYLGSASDFLDDYEGLLQACTDLVGTNGITSADCAEVHKALDAVELAAPWPCSPGQGLVPPLCPAGQVPSNLFYDDMEGSNNWTSAASVGSEQWLWISGGFNSSGTTARWSGYLGDLSDRTLTLSSPVTIPTGDVRMQFSHAFGFENNDPYYWDGGTVEYSTNGGVSWQSINPYWGARYGGVIDSSYGNPLGGSSAFVGDSWGYTASQAVLQQFGGSDLLVRFRVGEDSIGSDEGWWLDDVRIYQCVDGAVPTVSVDSVAVREGDSGTTEALFTARLSAPTGVEVVVNYATSDGSATAGVDYAGDSGTITIPPRAMTGTIGVAVMGDTDEEGDETFTLTLTGATNATVVGSPGTGTIRDDEGDPAPPATSSWALARRGMAHAQAITYGNSLYVAGGYFGAIHTSPDGIHWTERSTPTQRIIRGIAYGNGRYVAVTELCALDPARCGAQPLALTSIDGGATWTAYDVAAAGAHDLRAVAFSPTIGGGTFVAVGEAGTVVTSTDGQSWTAQTSGITADLNGAAFGAGLFVVGGNDLLTSPDGVSWTPRTSPSWWGLNAVTFTGTHFVGVGWFNLFTSPDGINWTDHWDWGADYPQGLYGVAGSGETIAVVSQFSGSSRMLTSHDGGVTWTTRPLGTGPETAGWLPAIAHGGAGFVAAGWYGETQTSPTGVTWTRHVSPASRPLASVAYSGTRFCAVGGLGAVASSADGITWVNRTPPAADIGGGIIYADGKFVAVGNTIATSLDCVTWIDRHPPLQDGLPGDSGGIGYLDLVRGDGLFVAVGTKGETPGLAAIATSPDAVTWTLRDSGFPVGVRPQAVGYGAGRYVIIGSQTEQYDGSAGEPSFLATSEDGITWTESPAPFGSDQMFGGISYSDGQFVAMGRSIWTSPDGLAWTQALDADDWYGGVAHGSSRIVAVGLGVYESSDGSHWTEQVVPSQHFHSGVAYSPSLDRFVVVGDGSIMYTNDPVPTISVGDVSMAEGNTAGTLAFPVTLSAARGIPVTVRYATANLTAVAGSDYLATSGTLTFAPGEAELTIDVPVNGDTIYEKDETLRVLLSAPSGATLVDAVAVGTLTNDDPLPAVSVNSVSVAEGTGGAPRAVFTVTLAGASAFAASVRYTASAGTATAPADFGAVSGTLGFAPGVTTRTFAVPIVADTLDEADETFNVTLSNPVNCTIAVGAGVGTILDDDTGGQIQFGAPTFVVRENLAAGTLYVTRTGGAASAVTVAYSTSDGTATANVDYRPASGLLRFGAGVARLPIRILMKNDALVEGSETLTVTLSAPTGGATLGAPATATLAIEDDDLGGAIELSAAAYRAGEGAPAAFITVKRSGGRASGVTVDYTTSDGTATAGTDYTATAGTLTFGAGVLVQSFKVPILNDTLAEGDETVDVTLTNPGGGATLGAGSTAALTIADNEPGVQFSAATYSRSEAGRLATITVRRLGGSGAFTADYSLPPGGSATPTVDYGDVSGTLSFSATAAARTFTIPIVNDTEPEGDETVNLALTSGSAYLGPQTTAVLTIVDDEASVRFSAAAYRVSEASASASIVVRRTGALSTTVEVSYATSDVTATAGADYTTTTGTLTFGPGVVARAFTVPINNDSEPEGDETIAIALSAPTNATIGSIGSAVLTITDNEPGVRFTATAYRVSEAAAVATIVARRAGGPGAFTVDWATVPGGTATAGADYTAASGTLSFGAATLSRAFTIPLIADTDVEASETVNLALQNPVGAFLGSPGTAILTINDNDRGGVVAFAARVVNGGEGGGTAIVSVKRAGLTAGTVTVDYATADGTAVAGSDYVSTAGTLTFDPGETLATFSVDLIQDAEIEGGETVLLSLSNVTGPALLGADSAATLVLVDDEVALQVGAADYSVVEGLARVTVVVVRSGPSSASVGVDYATSDGSATSGSDYTASTGTLEFSAGVGTRTIVIPILNDADSEPPETFVITLSSPSGGAQLGARDTATVTIVDND